MRSNNTSQNIQNPVVPFTTGIKGFKRGARIEIHGTPIVGPNQFFCVELFSGQDIAFNLNARFYANDNVLALNSCQQGNWQFEERHANPFIIGSRFEIKITNKMSGFKVQTRSGNLAIVAAAQVAPVGHSDLNTLFKAAKMPTISEAHFLRLSKWYVWPTVEDAYAMKQAHIIESLPEPTDIEIDSNTIVLIKINGQKINFSHRISAQSITMLGIRGDVQVTNVIMKKFDTSIVTYNSAPVVNAQGQSQPQPVIIIQQGENSGDRRQRRRRRMVFRALMGGVGHH